MPNPIEGVDILNFTAVLVWLISYAGCLLWMNFFSDAVRNWRTTQYDENEQPIQDALADWFKALTPLQVQLMVLVVSFLLPVIALVLLIFVFKSVEIASAQDVWVYIVTWVFAWLTSQQRYQRIKEPTVSVIDLPPDNMRAVG